MSETTCKAELHIGDDYGDNIATMHCQLPEGHEGDHCEKYSPYGNRHVVVTWNGDDAEATNDD